MASEFYQDAPRLTNQFDGDPLLGGYLRWRLPAAMFDEVQPALRRIGALAAGEWLALDTAAERNPPRHVPYDPWGRRVDAIETSDAWRALDRIAAEEGLVAIGYERKHGALSRIDQFARLYLYAPSSSTYSCPLAMTDGAARLLELYPDDVTTAVFRHLTTRDPSQFWTSGQWMTERTGGSDVSATSTVAVPDGAGYCLSGTKWFTSATTSQIAITLAFVEEPRSRKRELSVFLVRLRDDEGRLRGIRVNRLKDKLGTHALPTAELTLDGTPAHLIGGVGHGVRKISALFNVTRVYNAIAAVAGMRRAIALARDYATQRRAFGKLLIEHPLHVATLEAMELEWRAGFLLAFHVAELLGRQEAGIASDDELARLRLLIPVAKLYTAKQAVAVASEALECFGGAGYIEDTGLPRLLRDAQVLSIWEGTTNVLSLDVLRAIGKADALRPFLAYVREQLDAVKLPIGGEALDRVQHSLLAIERFAKHAPGEGRDFVERHARSFAYAIARTTSAMLLLQYAQFANAGARDDRATSMALRWCNRDLTPVGGAELPPVALSLER